MDRKGWSRAGILAFPAALLIGWWLWPDAQEVELVAARVAPLVESIDEDGRLRTHERYRISAPVAGRVQRLELREGDRVESGSALVMLQPMPLSSRERAETTSRLRAAKARAAQADQHRAALTIRAEQAAREFSRLERAGADSVVARQALDTARSEADSLRRESAAADFAHRSARAEAAAIEAALAHDDDRAEALVLRAPAAAVVLRVQERSERVVGAGEPLMELGDPQRMEVVVDLLSSDAVRVRPGMPMELHDWGGEGVLRASVRTVEPSAYLKVSPLGVEERRVDVIADLDNPPPELGDGYQVEARIVLWQGDALQVPATAAFREGEAWALFVVNAGRVNRRTVTLGHRGRETVEVRSGLEVGERVIRYPGDRVSDGQRVRAME